MTRTRLVNIQVSPELGDVALARIADGRLVVGTGTHPMLVTVSLPPPDKGEFEMKPAPNGVEIWWEREPS